MAEIYLRFHAPLADDICFNHARLRFTNVFHARLADEIYMCVWCVSQVQLFYMGPALAFPRRVTTAVPVSNQQRSPEGASG